MAVVVAVVVVAVVAVAVAVDQRGAPVAAAVVDC